MFTKYNPIRFVALLIAIVALSACAPQVKETPAVASAPEPVNLTLAVSDSQNDAHTVYEPILNEFMDQVKLLSNGNITINPVWDAGKNTQAGYEAGVVQLVRDGEADLGLAAARAWDTVDITSFQALQAPFLIDNDNLAAAVATSDIASRMLENLSKYGITGLTMWPEDLRHPFSLLPDKPILSPADISGRTIRVTDTGLSQKLIETLGGITTTGDGGYDGAESGLRQARSLSGRPTATANVTFFPKYQVLFANGAAFDKLSEAQQAILRQAAAAAQKKAIADHPSEVESGKTWCSDVGAVVLASAEQLAEFQKAAQPVFDSIEQDPQNAELVAAIRDLKAKTPASAEVQACESELAQQNPISDANAQSWSTGLPPNGVWKVELTSDDLIGMGMSKANAPDWAGVYTFTFKDGVFNWTKEGTNSQTDSDDGNYEVVDDFVRLSSGDYWDDFQWRFDQDGLHFHLLATHNDPFTEIRAMFEAKPWQQIVSWSTGLPPNGVWEVTLTGDDLIKRGVSKANAPDWAGVTTFTFQDGIFNVAWLGTEGDQKGRTDSCDGTYRTVNDYVSLMFSNDCGNEVDNFQWRVDEDGLHFHVIEIINGKEVEITAVLEAKPYLKIADK